MNQSDKGSFLLERERGRFEEKSRKNAEFSMKYEEILRKNDRKKKKKAGKLKELRRKKIKAMKERNIRRLSRNISKKQ